MLSANHDAAISFDCSVNVMEKQKKQKIANLVFINATSGWFIVTLISQLIFAYYILMLYWRSTLRGNYAKWNEVNTHFYVTTDITGNLVFALHVLLAAIVTILGPLQLIGAIRKKAPRFHRVSGRLYITAALLISTAGLYLTWVRSAIGGPAMSAAITANAIIIICSAFCTIRYAMAGDIPLHNRWAVHLFAGMSGVWLFRVFFMLWMIIHRAPVGFDPDTFTGPFLTALSVFVYIFPQVIVLLYFKAKVSGRPAVKFAFSLLLVLLGLSIAIGTVGTTMGMWLPRIG